MADRINKELEDWKEKYQISLQAYENKKDKCKQCQKQFDGDKEMPTGKPATSIYNFTRELVEAQINSNIPMPSVKPRSSSDRNNELADIIEVAIRSELDRMPSEELNDLDERITRIMGGSVYLTEWDNARKTHDTVGEIANRLVSPLEFIPQQSVFELETMDYFFLSFEETKERIKAKYGKDVEDESIDPNTTELEDTTSEELVTQVVCFYKKDGCVGSISWAGDTVLYHEKDYFVRKDKVCVECGKTQAVGETECICGSTEWEKRDRDFERLREDVEKSDGTIIPAMSPVIENGAYVMEDYQVPMVEQGTGMEMYERVLQDGLAVGEQPMMETRQRVKMEPTKIPYYTPKDFPISVRRNMSVYQDFFGESDCAVIQEQQIQANKAMTKIDQKIATTAEFFTKPQELNFSLTNDGASVLNVQNTNQIAMIKALSLQFDMVQEYNVIEAAYYQAKSMLAVTDTFQGKADPTATSGKAKEIQVGQAAGIQKSKRVMKNAAYADLFRNMFWFLLAFADEPRTYSDTDHNGKRVEKVFNRYDFLEQDAYGNWYYNDEFTFSVDEAGAMQDDKTFLLEDVRTDFSMGAFGNPQEPQTMLNYWKEKEVLGYPNAKRNVKIWEEKVQQDQAMLQMQMQLEQLQQENAMMGQKLGEAAQVMNEVTQQRNQAPAQQQQHDPTTQKVLDINKQLGGGG